MFVFFLKDEESFKIYPFKMVSDRERVLMGSCSTYTTRRDVTDDVRNADCPQTLAAVHERFLSLGSKTCN